MSNDMKSVIIPKSDQLNSDDLITGPITVKVTDVSIRGGQEQPISVHYEGDNGKPYKPCKSMCRVMVSAWGPDSKKYVGRTMTLYRDPSVKWAGMDVGGIRISHMSDIDETLTIALTMTRSNRKPFTVRPLASIASVSCISPDQAIDLDDKCKAAKIPRKRLLDGIGATSERLSMLPADQYDTALAWIATQSEQSL